MEKTKKGLSLHISRKIALWTYLATLIAGLAVRTIQMLVTAIDFRTGFYEEGHFSVPLLTGILWVGLIVTGLILWFGEGRYPARLGKEGRAVGLVITISSLSILAFGIYSFIHDMISDYASPNLVLLIVDAVLLVLSAVSLAFFGLRLFGRRVEKGKYNISLLLPAVWASFRLIKTFFGYTTIANISQNLFDILMLASMAIFLYTLAKRFSCGGGGHTETLMVISGICTSVFGLIDSIPRMVALFALPPEKTVSLTMQDFSILMMVLWITVAMLIHLLGISHKAEIDQEKVIRDLHDIAGSAGVEAIDPDGISPADSVE